MEKLSQKILCWLIKSGLVFVDSSEKQAAYLYIINKKLSRYLIFAILIISGISTGLFIEILTLSISCFLIRGVAGGCHLNSSLNCFIATLFLILGFGLFAANVPISRRHICSLICSIISFIILLRFAPFIHKNDWHSEVSKVKMRKKSLIYSGLIFLNAIIFFFFKELNFDYQKIKFFDKLLLVNMCFALGTMLASISVFIASLQNIQTKEGRNIERI